MSVMRACIYGASCGSMREGGQVTVVPAVILHREATSPSFGCLLDREMHDKWFSQRLLVLTHWVVRGF
jgi:hypothetical protein